MTKELDAAPGDIRALKYRIHELEGEVIGYKRILDGQGKAEPVAWSNASWLSNPHAGHFSAKKTDCFNVPLYTSPPDPGGLLRDALAQSIIAENARGLRESNEGIYAHPDTLQRAAFEAWYDSGAENRDEFMALVDAALQPQAAAPANADLLSDALSNLNDLADQKNAEIDALKEAMRLALSMLHFMNDNGYRLEEYEQGRMDAAIAALEGVVK